LVPLQTHRQLNVHVVTANPRQAIRAHSKCHVHRLCMLDRFPPDSRGNNPPERTRRSSKTARAPCNGTALGHKVAILFSNDCTTPPLPSVKVVMDYVVTANLPAYVEGAVKVRIPHLVRHGEMEQEYVDIAGSAMRRLGVL
jgi:hypothetical protein